MHDLQLCNQVVPCRRDGEKRKVHVPCPCNHWRRRSAGNAGYAGDAGDAGDAGNAEDAGDARDAAGSKSRAASTGIYINPTSILLSSPYFSPPSFSFHDHAYTL